MTSTMRLSVMRLTEYEVRLLIKDHSKSLYEFKDTDPKLMMQDVTRINELVEALVLLKKD